MILFGAWLAGFGIELYWESYGKIVDKKLYIEYGAFSRTISFSYKRLEFSLYTPFRKKNEQQFKQKINH